MGPVLAIVNPDSVLARTAWEMLEHHAGGDDMTLCPACGERLPCPVGRSAAQVLAAAGLAEFSGLVAAAREGLPVPDAPYASPLAFGSPLDAAGEDEPVRHALPSDEFPPWHAAEPSSGGRSGWDRASVELSSAAPESGDPTSSPDSPAARAMHAQPLPPPDTSFAEFRPARRSWASADPGGDPLGPPGPGGDAFGGRESGDGGPRGYEPVAFGGRESGDGGPRGYEPGGRAFGGPRAGDLPPRGAEPLDGPGAGGFASRQHEHPTAHRCACRSRVTFRSAADQNQAVFRSAGSSRAALPRSMGGNPVVNRIRGTRCPVGRRLPGSADTLRRRRGRGRALPNRPGPGTPG